MNYHSDKWITENLNEHYKEALQYFPEERIVMIALQGSQNYGLDTPDSDVDTKLITLPSLDDVVFNRKAISTTHIRANNEHIDFKDIRLYIQVFRKQNLNFLEILFTPYVVINPTYANEWNQLIENREAIARYDLKQAIKSMRGIAYEKYFAMTHEYPSRMEVIRKYSYDIKQLHHLVRVEEYIERYINGEPYEDCLKPKNYDYLKDIKMGKYSLEEAQKIADDAKAHIDSMCDEFLKTCPTAVNEDVDKLLDEVQASIIRKCLVIELNGNKI